MTQTRSEDGGMSVFLSYSRRDLEEAEEISRHLKDKNFNVFRDMEDILPTEDWRDRLSELISEADAIVFLLSPASVDSEVCAWEIDLAARLGKKIAPIVIKDVEGASIPPVLSRLNYIFATDRNRLQNAVLSLTDALSGHAEWARDYSKLLNRARNWEREGFTYEGLLGDSELVKASALLNARPTDYPKPIDLVFEYLKISQDHASRVAKFNRVKARDTRGIITPLVQTRIRQIREQVKNLAQTVALPAHMLDVGFGQGEENEINELGNIISGSSRWHPLPPERNTEGVDAHGFSINEYHFPCCGRKIPASNTHGSEPRQFAYHGCELDPTEPTGPAKLNDSEDSIFQILSAQVNIPQKDMGQVRQVAVDLVAKYERLMDEKPGLRDCSTLEFEENYHWGKLRNTFRGLPRSYQEYKERKFPAIKAYLLEQRARSRGEL